MQKNCFGYPVEFVTDLFGESSALADTLKKATASETPRVLLVADANLVQHTKGLGAKIGSYLQTHGIRLAGGSVILGGGERIKADNLQSAGTVISAALSAKLGRNDAVLALGGGALLDIAGYAAAQVRGGVKIIRVPTTPAAMMDAAFSEWAGVDSASVKDALRVPSVPAAVLIDPIFATSVLDGVWRGNVSEALRLALARDAALYKKLLELMPAYRERDFAAFEELVRTVVAVRQKKGATDLGLWEAAQLEALSGYKLPHGYALAIGVYIEIEYAFVLGAIKPADHDKLVEILHACGALDGMTHSAHLLSQPEKLLSGLEAWELSTGSKTVTTLSGLGKSKADVEPDREAYRRAIANLA